MNVSWRRASGARARMHSMKYASMSGGMAEWSMAVVLKTGRIGYDIAVIFCRAAARSHLQYLANFLAF
jgi:hypothetical protein